MLAVNFDAFGGPEVLKIVERPMPVAGSGEVVVKVAASTVNPTDLMMRGGNQAAMMADINPPYCVGVEFGGHVHALGEGVTQFTIGQKVMGIVNSRRPGGGAHAQYVCVPAASLAALAPNVDVVEAATVPMNGLTAKMVLELLDIPRGGSVLVTGGAGATGGYAIELARVMGLTVVADAKESDAALLLGLGANHVVPRGEQTAEAVRRIFPDGVDGLIDAAIIGNSVSSAVKDGGGAVTLRDVSDHRYPLACAHHPCVRSGYQRGGACLARRSRARRQADAARRHAAADGARGRGPSSRRAGRLAGPRRADDGMTPVQAR